MKERDEEVLYLLLAFPGLHFQLISLYRGPLSPRCFSAGFESPLSLADHQTQHGGKR